MGKIIKKKERIANMFDEIAPVYDSTGHILSMGVDRIWRKKIRKQIAKIPISPLHVLDLATGTGDLAIEISKINNSQIVGIDIATKMLDVAINKADKKNIHNITFMEGDALNLPFPDKSFDVVTIAFGIRNFENVTAGIQEINRVLRSEGSYFIIELTRPKSIFKPFYLFYLRYLLPSIGAILSRKKSAYTYLKDTISEFEQDEDLNVFFVNNGFDRCRYQHFSFGISTLYTGSKIADVEPTVL